MQQWNFTNQCQFLNTRIRECILVIHQSASPINTITPLEIINSCQHSRIFSWAQDGGPECCFFPCFLLPFCLASFPLFILNALFSIFYLTPGFFSFSLTQKKKRHLRGKPICGTILAPL